MISTHSRIFPQDSIDENAPVDGSSNILPKKTAKPFRTRSIDFSAETMSQRYRNSVSNSSFLSQASNNSAPFSTSIETLINYLTANVDNINDDKTYLKKFEELTYEVLIACHDPEIHRIVKSFGWTGSRYKGSEETPFDPQLLLQAFSNLYLKSKVSSYTAHISNLFGLGNEKGADQILSFCPDTLLAFLRRNPTLKAVDNEVSSFSFFGACMLADISGFSKFSASMCSRGVSGLDDLREATNGFLGHIVKTVYDFKGDVIAFAGDALICVFHDNETNHSDECKDEDSIASSKKSASCYRALQCACNLSQYKTASLSAHIGVSYGEMKIALLGGHNDQWVFLMNGACVSELADCINEAGSQEVAATKMCYFRALESLTQDDEDSIQPPSMMKKARGSINLVEPGRDDSIISPISTKETKNENIFIIDKLKEKEEKIPKLNARKLSVMLKRQSSRLIELDSGQQHALIENAALFVPRPILTAVYSESLEHIGELRQVTTLFLSLDSYSPEKHRDPTTLQPFFLMAQQILHESGGFLRQFLVDDKGCVFIAMWGMPSFTYANNCSRALFCGVSISLQAKELGHKCSIGITTGNVFCGNVGAPERRDYAGIGNEVNMAARLMSKAFGRILIDKNTYQNLNQSSRNLLSPAEKMQLKGMDNPVIPFMYNSIVIPKIEAVDEQPGYSTILRRQVKSLLGTQIDKISNNVSKSFGNIDRKSIYFTVILGLPGTGKSTAVEYFRHGARKRNIPYIFIQARPGHEGVPYGLMRELFLELVGEDNFETEIQQRQQINYLIEQAYSDSDEDTKTKARLSLELLLGVEWSDVFQLNSNSLLDGSEKQPNDKLSSPKTIKSPIASPRSPRSPISGLLKSTLSKNDTNADEFHNISDSAENLQEKDSYNGMFTDSNLALCRPPGDLTFYKVLCVLLHNNNSCLIIEDAHFCDELSWNELYLMILGKELNLSVLITMRSNPSSKTNGESEFRNRRNSAFSRNDGSPLPLPVDSEVGTKYGLKFQASASYLSIIGHENTTVIEMSGLNENEVRDILLYTLKVQSVSNDLVKLVLDVSSGNAFWCKAIANFIKERGVKELEKAIEQGDSRQHSLKVLILLRMEKLDLDNQLVLKYASIIGDEFSEKMLAAVLPQRLKPNLSSSLELLAEHGFILCIEEYPELIFGFQNQLIRQTLYELMPPSDAAHIHLAVAEFIEEEYSKNLRPFYPILGTHYKKSIGKRALAFKYHVKAADQAISRGAFGDGLRFVQIACTLGVIKPELQVLLQVINRALRDLSPNTKLSHTVRRYSRSFSGNNEFDQVNSRISAYIQLKINTETSLEKFTSAQNKKPIGGKGHLISRQPSARLNWQPSYVASKMLENEDESEINKDCCVLS